jgi:antitoxin VapB
MISMTDVMIKHFGNGVLLLPIDTSWAMLEASFHEFEPGFILKREQPEEQRREEIAAYSPLSG